MKIASLKEKLLCGQSKDFLTWSIVSSIQAINYSSAHANQKLSTLIMHHQSVNEAMQWQLFIALEIYSHQPLPRTHKGSLNLPLSFQIHYIERNID